MPRGIRLKPTSNSISEEILNEIKSFRPLRIFINKQKKKGSVEKPFTLRSKFSKLPEDKQARYLHKAVDKYIELLDEKDVEEHLQVECKLFDYLLSRKEQMKYFLSIDAPKKPPGKAGPYYTQVMKEETFDDNEASWKSLSIDEKRSYKRRRKEAQLEYSAQVRNFANDLPERLRTDYLLFAEQLPHKPQANNTSITSDHGKTNNAKPIRQRRKSLTALPDSLKTETSTPNGDVQPKLTRAQLNTLHKCMPSVIYYETGVPNNDKPTFTRKVTKNTYIKSLFNQLDDNERLKYILKSIKKWNGLLNSNPNIIENQIPTLHLLLSRNEDIILYFSSIGLPQRPPRNGLFLFNYEKEEIGSEKSWSDLSEIEKNEYSQQLAELKTEYYQKLVEFVDHILPSDYMRYEFFRNIKYGIKDYELATKSEITDKVTGHIKLKEYYIQKKAMYNDMNQFNKIKQSLLSTGLTNEQKNLIEDLSQLLFKYLK